MPQVDVLEIFFHPEKASRGLFEEPQPPLHPHTAVILAQRDEFLVGQWEDDGFIHPTNQVALAPAAEAAVRDAFRAESFASNTIRVFTCPRELAKLFDWNWPKRGSGPAAA